MSPPDGSLPRRPPDVEYDLAVAGVKS